MRQCEPVQKCPRCLAIGNPKPLRVVPGSALCWRHDPAFADKRRASGSARFPKPTYKVPPIAEAPIRADIQVNRDLPTLGQVLRRLIDIADRARDADEGFNTGAANVETTALRAYMAGVKQIETAKQLGPPRDAPASEVASLADAMAN
jgi:hypothetical protein